MCAEEDRWLERPPLHATVRVLKMSFFRKIITRHDTGLGEAYMDEDYEVTNSPVLHACILSQTSMTGRQTIWHDMTPKRAASLPGLRSSNQVSMRYRWMTWAHS